MFGPAKRQCRTRGRSKRTNLSIELNQSFETFNAVTRGMAIVHLACGFFVPAIVVRHWASKMPCGRSASYTNTRRQGSTSHMWMHAASDAPFQEKDEGFRLFCARLQARMVRGMPENDAYVEEAGLSIVSICTTPFVCRFPCAWRLWSILLSGKFAKTPNSTPTSERRGKSHFHCLHVVG